MPDMKVYGSLNFNMCQQLMALYTAGMLGTMTSKNKEKGI
jgi:hypothetical protein